MATITTTIRRFNGVDYTVALPKTVVEQIEGLRAHLEDNQAHVTTEDRQLLLKTAVLNEDGKLDRSKINKKDANLILDFESVEAFTNALPTLPASRLCFVVTGEKTWSMYQTKGEGQYIELANTLSAEVTAGSYDTVQDKPASSKESIDNTVTLDHLHTNLAVLDKLQDNSFTAKQSLATTKTIIDGQIPPNTDGLGVGSMLFVLSDPKVNPVLNKEENSLTSVLLKLNDGTHVENIAKAEKEDGTTAYVKSVKFTNNSATVNGTVRHTMVRNDDTEVNTDYIITPGEERIVTIDVPQLYKDHKFKVIDIEAVGEVDPKKYGVEIDIEAEVVNLPNS